ncbi:MAG: hypothetical protein AAFO61_11155 [Pseudomonadota bacterium]
MSRTVLVAAVLTVTFTTPAFAYIDPITGSVILQALIGGFAAVSLAVRNVREKIFAVLGFKSKAVEETSADDTAK